MLPIGPLDRPSAVLHSQISQGLQGIELNYLHPTFHRCLMQLATFGIEASRFSRTSRHDDWAIIFLGQALQSRASVHRVANGGDDLRPRRSHRTNDGLTEMNADSDLHRLRQVSSRNDQSAQSHQRSLLAIYR